MLAQNSVFPPRVKYDTSLGASKAGSLNRKIKAENLEKKKC